MLTMIGPIAVIGFMYVLYKLGKIERLEVWRNSIYLLFLSYVALLPALCRRSSCGWRPRRLSAGPTSAAMICRYPRTCETIMQAFGCHDLADGSSLLEADFAISCDEEFKLLVWPAAVAGFVVYALGVRCGASTKHGLSLDDLFGRAGVNPFVSFSPRLCA